MHTYFTYFFERRYIFTLFFFPHFLADLNLKIFRQISAASACQQVAQPFLSLPDGVIRVPLL